MISLNVIDESKLTALEAIPDPQVCEIVKVSWGGATGDRYYVNTQVEDAFPEIAASINATDVRLNGGQFQELTIEEGISDSSFDLDFWDGDGEISDLFQTHGAGVRVEVFYYFPETDLLLSQWWGHLQPPEDADEERFVASAQTGFRSSLLPLPRRAFFTGCQAIFGGLLTTQAEIDENDCWYNRHLGGDKGELDPETGLAYTDCPRATRGDCTARLGDSLSFLAFDTINDAVIVSQTKGSDYIARTNGNETNLKRPLRVIAGEWTARELDVLQYLPEQNNRHPELGSVRVIHAICEGPVAALWDYRINNAPVPAEHHAFRYGHTRQAPTGYSPNVLNYSGTTHVLGVKQGNFVGATASAINGSVRVLGKSNIRIYSSETEFLEQYTTERPWWLQEMQANKRWGGGLDRVRFVQQDYIDAAEWSRQFVTYKDSSGNIYRGQRSTFNAELVDRTAQQQIYDTCLAGRLGLPFPHQGKMRLKMLRREILDASTPTFSDYGDARNIVRENNKSTLRRTIVSDAELPNKIILSFYDAEHGHTERPLPFEDIPAQLAAGRAFTDTSRRVVEKKYSAFGVTNIGEASRLGNLLLHLGAFDEGGTKNNLRITFKTWFAFALRLHKYQVIRVLSHQLERYGFEYFRIRSMKRLPDLQVEISAQAYPVAYYDLLESETEPPPITSPGIIENPAGRRFGRPQPIGFDYLDYTSDRIAFRLATGESV
jgi:hypothetical protein